eukprot:11192636-Lingulodinium_polyedra.AAC.1
MVVERPDTAGLRAVLAPGPGKEARRTSRPRRPRYETPAAFRLFSGPTVREDGVRAIFERVGRACWGVDV